MNKYNNELETYPEVKNICLRLHCKTIKLEQKPLPDFIVYGLDGVYFIEVKFYRGKESMEDWDFETALKKVRWEPGQLKFLKEVRQQGDYRGQLWIFNKQGDLKIL